MRELLDYQSDQIERVLESHGVAGRVYGGAVSPRLVEFHVAPAAGVKISRIEALGEEIAMYLGVAACRVQRRGAVVSIEVPRDNPPLVKLLPLMSALGRVVPPASPVLGQDSDGLPIILRLSSPDVAHVLISGTTGSGKTELARSMILSLALCNRPDSLRLLLIDPKGRGYTALGNLAHSIGGAVSDVDEAHEKLSGLVAEMERRDRAGLSDPRIIVFIDELADLMMVGGKAMVSTMTRLTQRGREAGIHIVACTQKPTAAVVGGLVKSNFPARLVGSVASADDARIAAGLSGTGAERLTGRGDFLLVVKGDVRRLQAAYTSPAELTVAVARLSAARGDLDRTTALLPDASRASVQGQLAPHTTGSNSVVATFEEEDATGRPAAPTVEDESSGASDAHAPRRFTATTPGDPFEWQEIGKNLRMGYRRAL